jgi:hypothetical protein
MLPMELKNILYSPSASKAIKVFQTDEIMNKLCLLEVKGVMGMWASTYEQFLFWSLRSLDVALLVLHFKKVL